MSAEGGADGLPALPDTFAATLAGLARRVGLDIEADRMPKKKGGKKKKDDDDTVDVSAAATYLRPQIERLLKLEADLPDFPSNPAATPWHKIENDYLDPNCTEALADIVHRYGGTRSHAYGWSKKRRWKDRRAVILEIQARMSSSATMLALGARVSGTRKALGEQEETAKTLALLDRTLAIYEAQLESGQVQVKPADVDKIVRLAKFLRGHADKITEHRLAVTPDTVRAAAREAAKGLGDLDLELAGVVTDAEYNVRDTDTDGPAQPDDAAQSDSPDGPPASDAPEDATDQNGGRSSSESSADADGGGTSPTS